MQNWKQVRIPINSLCHWVEPAHLWWCKCVFHLKHNISPTQPRPLPWSYTLFASALYKAVPDFLGTLRQKGRTRDLLQRSLVIICMYVCHLLYVVHCLNNLYNTECKLCMEHIVQCIRHNRQTKAGRPINGFYMLRTLGNTRKKFSSKGGRGEVST